MFSLPKTALSCGTAVLALGALILAVPQTAHAIAATLVQVTNTVIGKNIDEPGRNAYASVATCNESGSNYCYATFPPVPAGMRLVVERASISAGVSSGTYVAQLSLQGSSTLPASDNGVTYFPIAPVITIPSSLGLSQCWNEQTKMYFEPGDQPKIYAYFGTAGSNSINANIFGYLVNLSD